MRHYAAIRPELAARFIDEVNTGFEKIIRARLRWRVISGSIRRALTKVFPFALLYFIDGDTAFIVAVAHGSREPGYWAERITP